MLTDQADPLSPIQILKPRRMRREALSSHPSAGEGGPLRATLKTANGAALSIDVDERTQGLTLTIDNGGRRASALLPAGSAATFKNLLISILDSGRDAGR